MKCFHVFNRADLLTFFVWLCLMPVCAFAQSDMIAAAPSLPAVPEAGDADTRLVVDTGKNIVRVMIAGREVGRFDKNGLHVAGNIEFTGAMTDTAASRLPESSPAEGGGDVE